MAAAAWTATVTLAAGLMVVVACLALLGTLVGVCTWADRIGTWKARGVAIGAAIATMWLLLFVGTLCCGTPR